MGKSGKEIEKIVGLRQSRISNIMYLLFINSFPCSLIRKETSNRLRRVPVHTLSYDEKPGVQTVGTAATRLD